MFQGHVREKDEKICQTSMWLKKKKKICLCISEEPSWCWQNKQPLGVFETGSALHAFKVERPRGISANVHPPRLERLVRPILLMMIGPREALQPAF